MATIAAVRVLGTDTAQMVLSLITGVLPPRAQDLPLSVTTVATSSDCCRSGKRPQTLRWQASNPNWMAGAGPVAGQDLPI